jgi:hypothetical protein
MAVCSCVCIVLFLIFQFFFPYSFLSCCYIGLSHIHTHSLDWYRDEWWWSLFLYSLPYYTIYISLKCRCLMNKQILFDGCEKKTKNVKKTKKNTVKSWCNETWNISSFIFSLFSVRVIVWLIYCTCLSENVVHLNLTRSHSQRVWWTVKNMEKIIFVFGLLPNAKSDVTHIVQVARVFKCLRQRYTQNRWGLF